MWPYPSSWVILWRSRESKTFVQNPSDSAHEQAVDHGVSWMNLDQGDFYFLTQSHWVPRRWSWENELPRQSKGWTPSSWDPLQRPLRTKQLLVQPEGLWSPLSTIQACFCHFKKSRQFLYLTKVESFKASEDWERKKKTLIEWHIFSITLQRTL